MVAVMEREHVDIGADNNLNTGKIINPLDQKVFASKPSKEFSGDSSGVAEIIHPLDKEVLNLRDGYIPSWSEVAGEFGLVGLPKGELKLWHKFYWAQRLYALKKPTKAFGIIQSLDKNPNFKPFEEINAPALNRMVRMVRERR